VMNMLTALTASGTEEMEGNQRIEQGSTPKRSRKRQVSTPVRAGTTTMNEGTSLIIADAEPYALEEGYATN
jgi:hypothetical protein